MDENFLLHTQAAQKMYHEWAKVLPVIDYHNHLSIKELTSETNYRNLAQLWILGDPYKHRAMRICGVAERYITGDAEEYEKFEAWMSVLPKLIGNPLYDWSILEMKRVFDIELIPGRTESSFLWQETQRKLGEEEFTPMKLLSGFQVEYAAPCALLTDDISAFMTVGNLAPSLRGDTLTAPGKETLEKLEAETGRSIEKLEDYYGCIAERLDVFGKAGCKFADHALDNGFRYLEDDGKNHKRFQEFLAGNPMDEENRNYLESEVLRFLAKEYAKRKWVMQLHIGAQRYTSSRLRTLAGPAGGFAGIGNCCDVSSLTRMLDDFEKQENGMPGIILFTLNPADNAVMSVLSGSYSQDGVAGKVQQGPAWWWCDHLYGMREVFETISSFGVLSVFPGMTTDSRSILSFVRHEYFRRALCGWLGEKTEQGIYQAPEEQLKKLVEDVCYGNAKRLIRVSEQ